VLRRADILQAEHALRAARANVGVARAAFFPSVHLTGALGTVGPGLAKLFAAGGTVWTFAPQITLPLFTGGQNTATLRAAQAGVRLEVARYEKAVQTAFREVADALAAVEAARGQIAVLREAVAIQERRLDLASARYRSGEDAYVNVLLAQQALYAARQARLNAEFRLLTNQVALFRALGGGWR
jgi:multidrug efflux system outer membrane protein